MAKKKRPATKAVAAAKSAVPVNRLEPDFGALIDELWKRPVGALLSPERWGFSKDWLVPIPRVDVFEDKGDVVVKAELPGMAKEDIQVNLSGSTLMLRGEKKRAEEVKEKDYHRMERAHGMFRRVIELPADVQGDKVAASFKDGVLEVRLPKTEEAKQKERSIPIE